MREAGLELPNPRPAPGQRARSGSCRHWPPWEICQGLQPLDLHQPWSLPLKQCPHKCTPASGRDDQTPTPKLSLNSPHPTLLSLASPWASLWRGKKKGARLSFRRATLVLQNGNDQAQGSGTLATSYPGVPFAQLRRLEPSHSCWAYIGLGKQFFISDQIQPSNQGLSSKETLRRSGSQVFRERNGAAVPTKY